MHLRSHPLREEYASGDREVLAQLLGADARLTSTEGKWEVEPGSSLGADDRRVEPFQVSQAAQRCLVSAIDQARALDALARQRQLQDAASAALVRGLIDNAATALWLLAPASRKRRLTNTLKSHMRNTQDHGAAVGMALAPRSVSVRRTLITAVAERNQLDEGAIGRGHRPSTPVLFADQHSPLAHLELRFAWKVSQGVANGRPWASTGLFEEAGMPQEAVLPALDDLTTGGPGTLLPSIIGLQVLQEALRVREGRAVAATSDQGTHR